MMTSSNGNISRVTGPLCGEFNGHGQFLSQRPVTQSFDVFFYLRPNKWLSTQSRRRWLETPSSSISPSPHPHPPRMILLLLMLVFVHWAARNRLRWNSNTNTFNKYVWMKSIWTWCLRNANHFVHGSMLQNKMDGAKIFLVERCLFVAPGQNGRNW